LVGAIALTGTKGDAFFRTMIKLFSVATAPVGIPMLLGLWWRRMTKHGALAGFVVGFGLGLGMMQFGPAEIVIGGVLLKSENLVLLTTVSSTLVAMIGVSFLFPATGGDAVRIADFFHRIETPIGALPDDADTSTARDGVASPFRVVGVSVALVGVMLLSISPFLEARIALVTNVAIGLVLLVVGVIAAWRCKTTQATEEAS
jgi:hypothetical protein